MLCMFLWQFMSSINWVFMDYIFFMLIAFLYDECNFWFHEVNLWTCLIMWWMAIWLYIVVLNLHELKKLVPPKYTWEFMSFRTCWVDRCSSYFVAMHWPCLIVELMFPPMNLVFCCCILVGLLILSLHFYKVSRFSFEDECPQEGDNVIPRKMVG